MARRAALTRRVDDDDDRRRAPLRGRDDRRDDDRRRPPPRDRDDRRERDREPLRSREREREPDRREREEPRRSGGGTRWRGWQKRDKEDVRRRAEQTGGGFDSFLEQGVDTFRAKVGENTVRFLPATWDNPKHYGYDVWVHSYVGSDESSYLCLDKNLKERCPICIAAKEAKSAGDDEEFKSLKPKQRVLAWVLDRNADDQTPLIYDMSWTFDRDVAALCDTKQGTLYPDQPDEGYDLTFRRKGAGLNTRYFGMAIDRAPTPIMDSTRDQDALLDQITEKPIPSLLKYYPAEYLQKVIEGSTAQPDEDLDDGREPQRGRDRDRDDDSRGRGRDRDEEDTDDRRNGSRRGRERIEEDEPRRAPRSSRRDAEEDDRPARGRVAARDVEDDRPTGRRRTPIDRRGRDEEDPDDLPADDRYEEDDPDARPRTRRPSRDAYDDEIPF